MVEILDVVSTFSNFGNRKIYFIHTFLVAKVINTYLENLLKIQIMRVLIIEL